MFPTTQCRWGGSIDNLSLDTFWQGGEEDGREKGRVGEGGKSLPVNFWAGAWY